MSKTNIIDIRTLAPEAIELLGPIGVVGVLVVQVTFALRRGGTATYLFFGLDALSVLSGDEDLGRLNGVRIE